MSIKISVTNYSKFNATGLDLGGHGYYHSDLAFTDGLSSIPSEPVEARDGQTKMEADQDIGKSLASDVFYIRLSYTCGGVDFGVSIQTHPQVFSVGPRPSWKILGPSGWDDQETAKSYTWHNGDVEIVATPESGHSSLSISVLIKDKK